MTEAQWAAFNALGGSDWLRSRIDKLNMAGIAKRERNKRMRADKAIGMTDTEIAARYGVDRTTAWRITS